MPSCRAVAPSMTGPITLIAGFESTALPLHGVDVADLTGHADRWREDIDAVLAAGVRTFRYPLRWHRIEQSPGELDWSEPDRTLGYLHDRGAEVIVDLLHHTSYPAWLTDGFRDRRFPRAYVDYAAAVAHRYPWLPAYTLVNEPFATLFLAGHEALWPPYDRGMPGFVRLLCNVLPALSEAAAVWSTALPEARHVWVDTCEHHAGTPGGPAEYAALANDRRHLVLDLVLGRFLDERRPALQALVAAGGESLLGLDPVRVDTLGLDYYSHSEWWYDEGQSHSPSPHPMGFAALAEHYGTRYGIPLALTETNLRGSPADRVTWLRYMVEQYERAVSRGVDIDGFCWFPFVDSTDWDSLLARPAGRRDPVGLVSLCPDGERRWTVLTEAWAALAAGGTAAQLPAYRLQPPCADDLRGVVSSLPDWPWQSPPIPVDLPTEVPRKERSAMATRRPSADRAHAERSSAAGSGNSANLVVLSHLQWEWVWQRPQHLVSRFAAQRAQHGGQTWFVEEPRLADVTEPRLCVEPQDGVTRAWLHVPRRGRPVDEHQGFDAVDPGVYARLLGEALAAAGVSSPEVLLYTPLALDLAQALSPQRLAYDVMDDLSAFSDAPAGLVLRHRQALAEADVVFAGGRSLHREASLHRAGPVHLFSSGVETQHYARARALREPHARPVAGYVGVVDERLDLGLIGDLARNLPDWDLRIVGPVAKISPADLPVAPNLSYSGFTPYSRLPWVMAGFDVALMPFGLTAATRSISPTKTLEYLAAGLPVVSSRVPDVVTDFGDVVRLADDGEEFAAACREALARPRTENAVRLRAVSRRHEWDTIARSMHQLMVEPEGYSAAYVARETSA
jgi:beta-glucosidase/6-phospho-beta-glucosidase/beta-galactosidase